MREVEIKARVLAEELLRRNLELAGVALGGVIFQHDEVFGWPDVVVGRETGRLADGDSTAPWLRIRTEIVDGATTHYWTFKQSQGAHLDKLEYELRIDDVDAAKGMIAALGFVPYSDVKKRRQQGKVDDVTICVDAVEGLGMFVELEKMTKDDVPYEKIADELWAILERLGVDRANEVTKGYDVLQKELARDAA